MRQLMIGTAIAAALTLPLFFNLDTPVHRWMINTAAANTLARDSAINGKLDIVLTTYSPRHHAWLLTGWALGTRDDAADKRSFDALIKADCYLPVAQCFYLLQHKLY